MKKKIRRQKVKAGYHERSTCLTLQFTNIENIFLEGLKIGIESIRQENDVIFTAYIDLFS